MSCSGLAGGWEREAARPRVAAVVPSRAVALTRPRQRTERCSPSTVSTIDMPSKAALILVRRTRKGSRPRPPGESNAASPGSVRVAVTAPTGANVALGGLSGPGDVSRSAGVIGGASGGRPPLAMEGGVRDGDKKGSGQEVL